MEESSLWQNFPSLRGILLLFFSSLFFNATQKFFFPRIPTQTEIAPIETTPNKTTTTETTPIIETTPTTETTPIETTASTITRIKTNVLQLKGIGKTAFSKHGDGLLPLSSALREAIATEAFFHLDVPVSLSFLFSLSFLASWRLLKKEKIGYTGCECDSISFQICKKRSAGFFLLFFSPPPLSSSPSSSET